jgi:type VI secretion system ImpM family protein
MARIIPFRAAAFGPSLFGKLPVALDFVRVNHDYPESIELDRWLQTGLQRLAARGQGWPSGCMRFVLPSAATEHALLGVVAGSRDRAGRRFPVAIYARVAVNDSAASLVLASVRFAEAIELLLAGVSELPFEQLEIGLRRLSMPNDSELRAADEQLARELTACTLSRFAGPLFRDAPEHAAIAALSRLRSRRSREGHVYDCFDCPVRTPLDVALWSHWLERVHAQPSSCLWNVQHPAPRALLCPGPLPERAPLFWSHPSKKHAQLCQAHEPASVAPAAIGGGSMSLASLFERLAHEQPRK